MSIVGAIMVPHPPIILPEVGYGEEIKIAGTTAAYKKAAALVAALQPETIILASPHSVMYSDYFHVSPGKAVKGNMRRFRAPQVKIQVEYDAEFVSELSRLCEDSGILAGTLGERSAELDHGTMIPLYFVNQCYTKYSLVRIGLSGLPLSEHYRFGQMIQKAAEKLQRRAVLIGSGDLSHKLREEGPYGFVKEGPEYDERIMDVMGRAAFDELLDFDESFCDKAAECGHRSFCILAGALDGLKLETERLSHEDTFGVGYGICTYKVTGEDESRKLLKKWEERRKRILLEIREKEDAYVRLARATIHSWIRNKTREPLPKELPKEMLDQRAGVFVSLHKDDRLRGCIGTIEPVRSCIAEEIQENAISAATRDPRFSPVSVNELEKLEINVDVLTAPEEISSKAELDVKKYGVIVSKGSRRGLLLPDLDGVDTVEEQVSIALRKAGISDRESGIKLERFEVVRHV